MKSKRILAALMAAGMVVSLASCNSSSNSSSASTDSTPVSESSTEKVSSAPAGETKTDSGTSAAVTGTTAEDILAKDFSEHYKISFASIQIDDALDYNQGDEWVKWWTDTFNIEWDITSLGYDVWTERLNTWINADDMPDLCTWNFNPGDAINYADQGLVKQMPENWRELYPNLSLSSTFTAYNEYYEDLLGGMYYFFRPVFANNFPAEKITSHMSTILRTDWAEEAGFDLSKELEEDAITISRIYDYCRAVKENTDNPSNFYPMYARTSNLMSALVDYVSEASGIAQKAYYLSDSDGQYHWGPGEEETGVKEAVRAVWQAYNEGLIYPEFYTLQEPDDQGHFYASGDAAATIAEGMAITQDRYTTWMKENLNLDYWDVANEFVITDDDGVYHGDYSSNYWVCNIFSPNIDDGKLERILTMQDYSCTEDGQLRIRLGIPEKDWGFDDDGNLYSNFPAGTSISTDIYAIHPVYGNMFILSDDFSFINPAMTERAREKATNLYKVRSERTNQPDEPDWLLESYSSQALNLASMTYYDEYANIITKSGDFDTNYDQWVSDKMAMIQPVLDELNAELAKQ